MNDYVISELAYDKLLKRTKPNILKQIKNDDVVIDNPDCVCKIIVYKNREEPDFFIKINADGFLINPINDSVTYEQDMKLKKYTGKENSNYINVDEDVFDKYVTFLKTKNESYYRIANKLAFDK